MLDVTFYHCDVSVYQAKVAVRRWVLNCGHKKGKSIKNKLKS